MWKEVYLAAGTDEFGPKLEEAIKKTGLNIKEFAGKHDISESTLYKITSDNRSNIRVGTLRAIAAALREEEGYTKNTVGLITTRGACDRAPSTIQVEGTEYTIKPLPAQTIEEEIIKGVQAERDGVDGIMCGPIAASTLERVVNIPVGGLQFDTDLIESSLTSFVPSLK